MILIRAGLVELICSDCHASIMVGTDAGFVELADVNEAEHEHQLTHIIEAQKEREALA